MLTGSGGEFGGGWRENLLADGCWEGGALHLAHFKLRWDWKQAVILLHLWGVYSCLVGFKLNISTTPGWLIFDNLSAGMLTMDLQQLFLWTDDEPFQTLDTATLPLRQAIPPHLNIYECCWAATFHFHSDCLARGSQSFPPLTSGWKPCTSLQSGFQRARLPPGSPA